MSVRRRGVVWGGSSGDAIIGGDKKLLTAERKTRLWMDATKEINVSEWK